MRYRLSKGVAVALLGVTLLAVLLMVSKPAASQNSVSSACFGCSADGKATPMTADGHPDLSGLWGGGFGPPPAPPAAAGAPAGAARGGGGGGLASRSLDGSVLFDFGLNEGAEALCTDDTCQAANQPPYNDKYMLKVKAIGKTEFGGTSGLDPDKSCKPAGVPRSAIGGLLVQTPHALGIIHGDYTDRFIYIDGRPHPSPDDLESSYMGDSVGHWDGNTLVVDTIGFNDDTWLGGDIQGTHIYTSIHSTKEHVIERLTRQGDVLTVETTVEDPEAFTKPWVLPMRRLNLNKDPGAAYPKPYFCDGSGISAIMQQHYVIPSPEDRDIKYKCAGHRCDAPSDAQKNCKLTNKQNCQ